ncbi:gamma-glutamyl-gamma-aminobutyrate hydrolase family protein [Oligoflexaceae bacterium]|nr:gamma-glutamyl-gamma-aminobutyrate hydrolase family protein [Oligoflexaceae bacterium]
MPRKPIIAVTGPDSSGTAAWLATSYSIRKSGGEPRRIQPNSNSDFRAFDGLVLGGGTDIHPAHCERLKNQDPSINLSLSEKCLESILYPLEAVNSSKSNDQIYDIGRDTMEFDCLRHALETKIPVLGICRGHQLVNAHLGGTLYESTRPFYGTRPRIRSFLPRKKVKIVKEDSIIHKLSNQDSISVNALHDQAVAEPADGFVTTCLEDNGVIQATECKERRILTVQWHPEYLFYLKHQLVLFRWLVEAASQG